MATAIARKLSAEVWPAIERAWRFPLNVFYSCNIQWRSEPSHVPEALMSPRAFRQSLGNATHRGARGSLAAQEKQRYCRRVVRAHAAAHERARGGLIDNVPLHWMLDWPMPVPLIVERASGARLGDIDGNQVLDLCLGDTGAMFGHGPAPILRALAGSAQRGLTTMLPSSDAEAVGRLLSQRFPIAVTGRSPRPPAMRTASPYAWRAR